LTARRPKRAKAPNAPETASARDIEALIEHLRAATGSDRGLDAEIARVRQEAIETSDAEPEPYTSSVDACIALVHEALPDWSWQVGYGPKGIMAYATVNKGANRHDVVAPTVPLALLIALFTARPSPAEKS
jgi:hypothetical protein